MANPGHQWFLGKPPKVQIPGLQGFSVYVGTDLQKSVVFIGEEDTGSPIGIRLEGTAFLIAHEGHCYLITARHVAEPLNGLPFLVRVTRNGRAMLLHADNISWEYHPDPTVDLAAIGFVLPSGGFEEAYLESEGILSEEQMQAQGIGTGSLSYVIGLFQYVHGRQRNMPMVHAGNIALMPPSGEKIPVTDANDKVEMVEAYLVESAAIDGSSGSPVFARPGATTTPITTEQGHDIRLMHPEARLYLIGLYQGAWFGPPDEIRQKVVRAPDRSVVPVGIGVVVPGYKIIELLNSEPFKVARSKQPPVRFIQTYSA